MFLDYTQHCVQDYDCQDRPGIDILAQQDGDRRRYNQQDDDKALELICKHLPNRNRLGFFECIGTKRL